MKKILYIIGVAMLLVACTKEEQDYLGAQTGTLAVNVQGFPVYDNTPTRAVGTTDAGKTAWATGDNVFLKLQLKKSGSNQGSPLYYTLTYTGSEWNLDNPLPKVISGNRSTTVDYTAYYAPAYEWNSSDGTLSLLGGKVAGTDEYLVQTTTDAALTDGININFTGTRNYSRLRIAAFAPSVQLKLTCANFTPVNTTSPLGSTVVTLTADANSNACLYGTWAAATSMTVKNSTDQLLLSKTGIAASENGRSYVVDATFPAAEAGVAAPRIYVELNGGDPKLMLTKRPTNLGAFFKFGSVVAINATTTGAYNAAMVLFNPTAAPTFDAWNDIPYATENVDINTAYHTVANVTAGKGDPCRLVGYSVSEIKDMLTATTVPDNHQWRLPTKAENETFTGGADSYNPGDLVYEDGVSGVWFPRNGSKANGFLPAAGYRYNSNGSLSNAGSGGAYWSSSAASANIGWYLHFNSSNVSQSYDYRYLGFSVRCVRQ